MSFVKKINIHKNRQLIDVQILSIAYLSTVNFNVLVP